MQRIEHFFGRINVNNSEVRIMRRLIVFQSCWKAVNLFRYILVRGVHAVLFTSCSVHIHSIYDVF